MQKKGNMPMYEIIALAIGELIVSAITVLIFFFACKFKIELPVILGTVIGSAVTVLNFIAHAFIINRAIDKILIERGTEEMDDEQAEKFALEHKSKLQLTVRVSFIVRMALVVGTLALTLWLNHAFGTWHIVLATVIPLVMYRPLIWITQFIRRKKD